MSISLRKFRALVMAYKDVGTAGEVDSAYQVRDSGDADKMWWASRIAPSGHEVTTGMQPDHRQGAVFGFAAHVPIEVNDAILCNGEAFSVRSVLTRDYGRDEVQVDCERIVEQVVVPA